MPFLYSVLCSNRHKPYSLNLHGPVAKLDKAASVSRLQASYRWESCKSRVRIPPGPPLRGVTMFFKIEFHQFETGGWGYRMNKPKIVAAIWAIGMLIFACWVVILIGVVVGGFLAKPTLPQASLDLLVWSIIGGFAISGFMIGVGILLKLVWKLSDEDVNEKLPKIMQH